MMVKAVTVAGGTLRYAVVGFGWIAQAPSLPGVGHTFSQPLCGQNLRATYGFWAGPAPKMGPYPPNAGAQEQTTKAGTGADVWRSEAAGAD